MRIALASVFIVLAGLSAWLWYQVREAHDSWSAYVVQTADSQLVEARRIEAMLRQGAVDEALDHLQRNRDVFVLSLASVQSATSEPSWRWSSTPVRERAISALREEAEYRRTVGGSNSAIAEQVQAALEPFSL
jgi:hypothetical protein